MRIVLSLERCTLGFRVVSGEASMRNEMPHFLLDAVNVSKL